MLGNIDTYMPKLAQHARTERPNSPAVKGSRSVENMCASWPFHPRSDTNALMMSAEPIVKQMANLEGARMMMGRNRENARMENSSPAPSSARNHVKFMVFGMLDCALHASREKISVRWAGTVRMPGSRRAALLPTAL